MAGDWIKMRTQLAAERATMLICDMTGLDQFAVVGRLHAVWSWAGEHTSNGVVRAVTLKTIDRVTSCEGFGAAMVKAEWLEEMDGGGLKFPRWAKYHSKSARARALAALRQTKHRNKKKRYERYASVTDNAPRGEENGEERREENLPGARTVRADRSPKDSRTPREEPLPLDQADWTHIVGMAEAVGRKIPPKNERDRRYWLKYAVMADIQFSENWLIDATEAVLATNGTRRNRQAHFVSVLKSKAAEQGISGEVFRGIARRIEIPPDIWGMEILEIRK